MSDPAVHRWSRAEHEMLVEMRRRLANEMAECGRFPEVVGDRGLIRFIRGHGHNIDKATEMYGNYLRWRKENNVDAVREDIVHGGKRPRQFPYAEDFLIRTGNQVIMSHGMRDLLGNPVAVETYEYSPRAILAGRTMEMYTEYMIYCMEFKMLVVEQLSELEERRYLAACNYKPPARQNGYGVVYQVTILRDLAGVSMEFMSAESKALLKVSLDIAQNNYPEMLYKSHLVNTGWVFSTIWYFVKGLLDVRTAAKVTTTNSYDIPKSLAHEISADCIPNFIKGGKYDFSKEPEYVFDLTPYGPLHFFATDGSKPSCFLEHWCMQHALPAPALQDVPAHAAAVAAVPPTPPEGEVAVTGILRHASDAGFEHARRRSLSGNDLHKVKAVILDLDGTLLATEALSEKVLTRVLSRLGATDGIPAPVLTPTLKLEMMGLPDAAWTKLVVNTLQLQDSLTPADLLSQWEAEMEELMGEVTVMPGALSLIDKLAELGIPLAIATSSSERMVAVKRRAQPAVFDKVKVIVCGDDAEVTNGKPSPDIFIVAARRLEVLPASCLVVEDSANGVTAGKAAGMRVCACVPPYAPGTQEPTPEVLKAYIEHITSVLTSLDSIVGDLSHFEFVKFGLFASSA